MNSLTVTVNNISNVLSFFDTVQIRRYTGDGIPDVVENVTNTIAFSEYTTVSGEDVINNRDGVSDVQLVSTISVYYFTDPDGTANSWYITRYYHSTELTTGGWSDPIQGDPGDLYYNPQFPPEISYGSADQLVINRIRLYIGDPIGLRREYGEEALSSIHSDGKTYEMDEKGWPAFVNMGGVAYTSTNNPSVNGYRFLRFTDFIDEVCKECVTYSGTCPPNSTDPDDVYDVVKEVSYGIDLWYYTFRHSDREIMEAYENCPPPTPLTTTTANSEVYMIQTAIDLLRSELWEDATEDGAVIKDDQTSYDPSSGLEIRRKLLADLVKRRDDLVKSLQLTGITGVLID